jgi:serine/threonine-protein kinase ATR
LIIQTDDIRDIFKTIRDVPEKTGERFQLEVLSMFPPIFHEWFLEQFPEPTTWLKSRLAYSRTAAVISMVGFVLGYEKRTHPSAMQGLTADLILFLSLGDRHGENILFDSTTGDTVHVDFNCLFDKASQYVTFTFSCNV